MSTPTLPKDVRPTPVARDVLPITDIAAPRSSVASRATLALSLLVGYFVLAAAVVGLLGFLSVQALTTTGAGLLSLKLALFTGIVAVAITRAVFTVERRGADEPDGVPIPRSEQPELWALVDEVSRELSVPPPDHLWLVDDVNAYVRQDTRLLGLVGGRRHMAIGVALLQVLSVDQLRGVIGHELGHYAGGDTRLSALVYRASATISRTTVHLGPASLLGRLFGRYARLYQRVTLSDRRRQELRADAGSVRVVGRAVHASALQELDAAAAAWFSFGAQYVTPLWRAGTAPADLYVGFRALLADPERQRQLEAVPAASSGPVDPYDSHPSLSVRLEQMQAVPDRPAPGDVRPARLLLRDAEQVERRVTETVNARVLQELPAHRYSFAGPLDAGPYVVGLDEQLPALSHATAAVDGGGHPAGLGRTLALLEAGRDGELVTALTGDRRDLGEQARAQDLRNVVLGLLARAAGCALVAAGTARWQVCWSQGVRLVDERGELLSLTERLDRALHEQGVAGLRGVLSQAGVPLGDEAMAGVAAPSENDDDVVAVWPELVRRGCLRYDAIVTRDLLVLVKQRRTWSGPWLRSSATSLGLGSERLRAAAAERIGAVLRAPLSEVCRRPDVHTVRWDDLPSVAFAAGMATAWVLRLPGQPAPFDTLKAEIDSLVPSPAQTAALLRQLVGSRLDSKL